MYFEKLAEFSIVASTDLKTDYANAWILLAVE